MNESDRKLIHDSYFINDWNEITELVNKAESAEAKQILLDRKKHLYHKEEAFAGQL